MKFIHRFLLAAFVAAALILPASMLVNDVWAMGNKPGNDDVSVGVSFNFGPPPPSVVYVSPGLYYVSEDVYFYGGYYWFFRDGVWYRAATYPPTTWVVIQAPPAVIVGAPVRYRALPPGQMKKVPFGKWED